VSFEGTEVVLEKLCVRKNDVARLDYRGKGGPDSMRVEMKNGRTLRLRFNYDWNAYWNVFSSFMFTPLRCLTCPDQFNELADVSMGDAWLRELRRGMSAESVVVARTPKARNLLVNMVNEGLMSLRPVALDKVKESQAFSLNYKKKQFAGRLSLLRRFGYSVPDVRGYRVSSSKLISYAGAFLSYMSFRVSSNRRLRGLLVGVPLPLFRLYFGFFKCVFWLSRGS
jgi:coenzyme F420 hydrogenase subunit beta